MKQYPNNKSKKEKEFTLSLFRIPINFFAENDSKSNPTIKNSEQTSESDKKVSTSGSTPKEHKITLDENNKNANINISTEIEVDATPKTERKTTQKSESSPPSTTTSSEPASPSHSAPSASTPQDIPQTINKPQPSTQQPTQQPNSQPTPPPNPAQHDSPTAEQPEESPSTASPAEGSSVPDTSPAKEEKPSETENSTKDTDSTTSHSDSSPKDESSAPSEPESGNPGDNKSGKDDKPKDTKSGENDKPKDPKSGESGKPKDPKSGKDDKPRDAKSEKADELKDKYGKKSPHSDRIKNAKDNAKKKIADKVGKTPAGQKALKAINTAKKAKESIDNTKEAIQNMNPDKIADNVANNIVDGALEVGKKFADTKFKGARKLIEAAENTELVKNVKNGLSKAIKCSCIGCGATGCIIILIPIIIFLLPFAWITNLFGRDADHSIYKLDAQQYEVLQKVSLEYSMQEYTDMTRELYKDKPTFWENLFGFYEPPKFPIHTATEEYISRYSFYSTEMAAEHNKVCDQNPDLVDGGYIFKVKEGDYTSFGMAFESLKANYTTIDLKAQSSAPILEKPADGTILEDDELYSTSVNLGEHQMLFEEVLNKPDALKKRFEKQVDPDWFDGDNDISGWLSGGAEPENWRNISFSTILDTTVNGIYISDFEEERSLTLRDLFNDTSVAANDTEYSRDLVMKLFSATNPNDNKGNVQIRTLYRALKEKLAMLELMTYMYAYQRFDDAIETFIEKCEREGNYDNINMFKDPEFWAQFLTFSNVEYYLGLSRMSDHSLAYEIAISSLDAEEVLPIDAKPIYKALDGNDTNFIALHSFENWYATYIFDPETWLQDGKPVYSPNLTGVHLTDRAEHLFNKYNVAHGLYDYYSDDYLSAEEKDARNRKAFFAVFSQSTGLNILTRLDEQGNLLIPPYISTGNGNYHPLAMADTIPISFAYGQKYSKATISNLGLLNEEHTGIDYSAPIGTPVVAIASGTAYVYEGNTGYGNYVKIVHDDGYVSIYAHGNGTVYVSNGSRVEGGQKIMLTGNSGNSTGPHLHFEVRNPSGAHINPTSYIYGN